MSISSGRPRDPHDVDLDRGGRTLRVRVAGSERGPLVLYMHGSPSSRLDIDYLHARSAARGVRLAAFDRPGFGGSEFHRFDMHTIVGDAAAIADSLGAREFAVMGQSSGVAYAASTAALLPGRVTALATAGGGSPFEPDTEAWDGLGDTEREGVSLIGTNDEKAERLLAEADAGTFAMLELDDAGIFDAWTNAMGPADQRVMSQGFGKAIVATMRESLRQGPPGWARDNVVRMGPWHVDLSAVTCPAILWVGEQDTGNVGQAKWLAGQIQHAELRALEGHGHLVAFELWEELLDGLVPGRADELRPRG